MHDKAFSYGPLSCLICPCCLQATHNQDHAGCRELGLPRAAILEVYCQQPRVVNLADSLSHQEVSDV